MNRQYRLVWNKRLRMRVAVAESARATGKGAAGETVVATAPAGAIARAGSAWQRALAALGAASLLSFGGNAWAGLSLPSGSLLDINSSASYSSGWTHYSLGFTPVSSGNNYFLFAFRQDPAFWTFGQVSLTASGSSTNLFT
ncbi:MAG: ESPR domain-containing protein, partial [Arthrobacter sp.]|nr:ESPR domain-containing protein [Arthrobacter sp.]